MSPSRSKSKKAGKELQKTPSKTSGIVNVVNEHSNGYSPLLGKFDSPDNNRSLASPVNSNGRFHDLDETDDQTLNVLVTGQEDDSVSNNDSWSGESEDTNKEKTPHPATHQDLIPGADNDKREKIRQKNEKKHQRQKEKRAQELHERCSVFLISRKLEALARQLVAMGFSSEKATMSLMLNEGKIEESVAWLLEAADEADKQVHNNPDRSNLKMDLSEELAQIATMVSKYNCSKQEVERAVVACEGDLDKAAETMKLLKRDSPTPPSKMESTVDHPPNQPSLRATTAAQQRPSVVSNDTQPRREEKDFNYTKSTDLVNKTFTQPKLERTTMKSTTMTPTVLKPETEMNIIKLGSIKEPVVVMQRPPQTSNLKQQVLNPNINYSSNWLQNEVTQTKMNALSSSMAHIPSARSFNHGDQLYNNQLYNHLQYQQHHHQSLMTADPRNGGSWNRVSPSPFLSAASNLGLFSRSNSNLSSGSSPPVDWNACGSMFDHDYNNIDWSLDQNSARSKFLGSGGGGGGMWQQGFNSSSSSSSGNDLYEQPVPGLGGRFGRRGGFGGGNIGGGGGGEMMGSGGGGSREWSSPFEEMDLFSLPRQFVSSSSSSPCKR